MSKIKPLARRNDIVIQEFNNEILIYDLKSNKAYNLNETSALIWQLSNGDKTISEIAEIITTRLNSPINEELVWLALQQLQKENLIKNKAEISNFFATVSRREIVRKAAISSAIALPIVLSLIAPNAIQAGASVCVPSACRCPNASAICPGSTVPGVYVNCNTSTGNNACDCKGPYGAADSAGVGFKTGNCSL